MEKTTILNRDERFGKLIEQSDNRDLPFYNAMPMSITGPQWALIMLSVIAGFLALVLIPQHNNIDALLPRSLFVGLPLATLIYITKDKWKTLFHKPTRGDYLSILGFLLLNGAVSVVVALIVSQLFGANSNHATDSLANAGVLEFVAFYVGTAIQIMGEELFTILPFLGIAQFLYMKKKVSRKNAIILAWLLTSIWFGAAHLPTYGWNLAQALLIIGSARMVLTLAFIRTKNIWVSYGAHLLNDWVIFTLVVVLPILRG